MLLIITSLYIKQSIQTDPGHIFGQGGLGGCDHGHRGYDTNGNFGPVFEHHNGAATHAGDIGKNQLVFMNDVIHHGEGGVFVSKGPSTIPPTLSIDNIHNKIGDAMNDAHNASIAGKEAAKRAELLNASIADERAKQKEEEIARLKELDDAAAKQEHVRPEVLGKTSIPVATFTLESFPLFHHVRGLLARVKAIQDTEQKAIDAQSTITRLDDITDVVRLQDVSLVNPKEYDDFLTAGNARSLLMHIPVDEPNGNFYVSNSSGAKGDHLHDVPMRENKFPDGHAHFHDHGLPTDNDLQRGGSSVGTNRV